MPLVRLQRLSIQPVSDAEWRIICQIGASGLGMTTVWAVPLVAVALTQVAVFTTSIYLHRALAHRSLRLHPVAEIAFRVALWLTTGMSRQQWVAVHRKHHTYTDREGDPHSPKLLEFWHVQLYMREARSAETLEKFAPDLPPDRLDRVLFSRGRLGVWTGLGPLCAVLGLWPGLIAGLLHAALYVFVIAPLFNALGHWRGTKISRTPPPTRASWRGSPGARACTTTTTPIHASRSSACAARSSIPRGRSSDSWPRQASL